MLEVKVINNYAAVLFDMAENNAERQKISNELKIIAESVQKEPDVKKFLCSNASSKEEKDTLLEKVFSKTKVQPLVFNFIKVLAKNARIEGLSEIIKAFDLLIADANNEKLASIKYARELNEKDKAELVKLLERDYKYKFVLEFEKQEDLVAGIVISFDSVVIDASVKGMLGALASELDAACLRSIKWGSNCEA